MKYILTGILLFFSVSCTQTKEIGLISDRNEDKEVKNSPEGSDLPQIGVAPELKNDVWFNANKPLRLSEMEGKVILLEMWTFG